MVLPVQQLTARLYLPVLGADLDVKGGTVTLNEGMAPYGQAVLTCVAPDPVQRALIDPRNGVRANLTLTQLRHVWQQQAAPDVVRPFDLTVRSRPVTLSTGEVQLTLATDEALLIGSGLVATSPYAPVTATARQVVAYVLATIGATLQPGIDDAQLLPSSVTWQPGQSGWDFLEPILQAAGLRLYCDEVRRWWLVTTDVLGPGFLQLRHDHELTATGDVIDLDSGGYFDAVVVTYTSTDSTGATHTTYDVARDATGTYNLAGSPAPTQRYLNLTLSGGGSSVMQGATQPQPFDDFYSWHAVPGSNGSATPYETLVVDRHSKDTGALLDSMTLLDAGHGTSIGIEVDAAGVHWLWLHWLDPGAGVASDLVRLKYQAGFSGNRAAAAAGTPALQVLPRSWADVGGAVPVTSFDFRNDWAVMHLGSTIPGRRTYVRRRIADLRAGVAKQYGATILVPEGPPTLQGFTTVNEAFFRYVGRFNEPQGDPAVIEEWSWADGTMIDQRSTSAYGRNADGSYPGDRHEPEGLQIVRLPDGTPALDVGVILNVAGSYQAQVWRQALTERTSTTPLRVLSLAYETSKPAAGAAAAIRKRRLMFGRSLPLTAVSDFGATPGMPAAVTLEDGGDELQVSLSAVTWRLPDDEMDVTTRDVVPVDAHAWLRVRPGVSWASIPAAVAWTSFDPTNAYAPGVGWTSVPVGRSWQSVAAGVAWTEYAP